MAGRLRREGMAIPEPAQETNHLEEKGGIVQILVRRADLQEEPFNLQCSPDSNTGKRSRKKQEQKEQEEQEKQEQKEQEKQEEQVQEKQEQLEQKQEQKQEEQKHWEHKHQVQEKQEQAEQVQVEQEGNKQDEEEQEQKQEKKEQVKEQKQENQEQEVKEQKKQEQEEEQKEWERQKEREQERQVQERQEQQEQEEAAKDPDISSSENQTKVSAPERAEEWEKEATGTASPDFIQGRFRSITDVRENVQGKAEMAVGAEMDKQREQNLSSEDSGPAATDSDARDANVRAKKWTMGHRILKLLVLILLTGCLISQAAPLLTVTSKIHGSGRPEQGQNYSLTCEVEGLAGNGATSSYVWYKTNTTLNNEEGQVLYFPKLSQGDAGNYECEPQLSVKEGSLLRELFQLQVLVFENMTMVPEVEVEEGETVLINCSVHSVPTAQLVWTMDHEILRIVESNFDSLVLHNASQHHLKVFVCQASNREFLQFLEKYTQIRIKGTYEIVPQPVLSSWGLSVLGQPFSLICVVLDLPQNHVNIHLTYTWFKDSREIPGQSGEVLQFPSLTREDGGEYQCRVRNGKPQTTSPESHVRDVLVLLPPRVHVEPATPDKVIRRAAGEELTLTCKVTEAIPWVPHNGYSWSYLPSPEGPERPLAVRESTLTLGPLTREDSGQYFCQARNDLEVFQGQIPPGDASVTVDVVYLEKMTLTPDLEVNEGDYVTLTCRVDSNPAAGIAWVVDGREVRHVTHNTDQDHYVLESAACSDSKTYTCRASNAALPGLERNTSTNLRVNCSEADSDGPSSPLPDHGDKGKIASGPNPSPLLWLLVLLLVVPVLGAILLFRKKHYLKQLMCSPENPPEEIYIESAEPLQPEPAAAAQKALDSDTTPL